MSPRDRGAYVKPAPSAAKASSQAEPADALAWPTSRWLAWAVALAAAVPFLPALAAGFVKLDDDFNFLSNKSFHGLGLPQLKWMFFSFQLGGVYQPLAWVTHGLDYALWGLHPLGYHLTNIVIHSLTAAAFYFLALRFLRLAFAAKEDDPRLAWCAAFTALFFCLHPLRVEVVAWVSNRSYVLPGLFYVMALNAYLRAHDPLERRRGGAMLACAAFFALSLLSKAVAMTLPAILLVLDCYPLKRFDWDNPGKVVALAAEKIPILALAAAAAVIAANGRYVYGAMIPVGKFGVTARVAQALFGLSFYAEKTLLPVRLAPLYTLPPHLHPLDELCLPRTIVVGAVTALTLAKRKELPWLLAAWAAHVAALLPFLGLSQYGLMLQIAADKWFHIGSVSWALLAGGALWWALQAPALAARRRQVSAAAAAVLVALGALTLAQTTTWHDTETLFNHNLAVEPDCYFCHNNLTVYLNDLGRHEDALAHALESLRIKPDYQLALINATVSYEALGQIDRALAMSQRAAENKPNDAEALFDFGYFLSRVGRLDDAIAQTKKALELNPNLAKARNNMGFFYEQKGRYAEAITEFETSLRIDPDQPMAKGNLAAARQRLGEGTPPDAKAATLRQYVEAGMGNLEANRMDEAITSLRAAVLLDPKDPNVHYNLGYALVRKGDLAGSVDEFQRAIALKPDFGNAHFNLGFVQHSLGRLDEAERQYREAIRFNPTAPNAYVNLGVLLTSRKRLDEADRWCSAAVKLDPAVAGNAHCHRRAR